MSHPIYIEPNAANFQVSPTQYAQLQSALKGDRRVSNLDLTASGGGTATIEGVNFSWAYDGTSSLVVTIVKKHGFLVEHYPNATIFDALQKQIPGSTSYTTGQVQAES